MAITRRTRITAIVLLALAAIGGVWSLGPIPQDPDYHHFADSRAWLSIPNFGDVASNFAFVVTGVWGLGVTLRRRNESFWVPGEYLGWIIAFLGVLLTGFGSAYYHHTPTNETLFWDRLPLTAVFGSLIMLQIGERVSPSLVRTWLGPMVLVSMWSVSWWRFGPQPGDLRPYAITQFVGAFVLVAMLILLPSRFDRTRDFALALLCYGAAKVCEALDRQIFEALGFVSGHTIKHLLAAGTPAVLAYHVMRRSPKNL